jgi:hypothetical protein
MINVRLSDGVTSSGIWKDQKKNIDDFVIGLGKQVHNMK